MVGGGLTGLWTALHAAEEGKRVVLLEGERIAFGASGRNGGFCAASLTHGIGNGLARWPDEMDVLERLGRENLAGDPRRPSRATASTAAGRTPARSTSPRAPHQVAWLAEEAEQLRRFGWDVELLDAEAMRAQVDSPTYLGGVWARDACALVDPARLCWGLARAAEAAGAAVFEGSPVTALETDGAGVRADTAGGRVLARRALLATSAFPPLVRAIRRYVVPVYDYVLVTEPLSEAQRDAIGWRGRQGLSDVANQFHYYRQTDDHRILWGGYDAVYDFGGRVAPDRDQRPATFELLAEHFFATFPQLEGLRFSASMGRRDRHLQPLLGAVGDGRWAAAPRTSSASPASAWARAGSARAWGSTCSTASTPSARGWRWCAAVRCRSRPSRRAGPASSSPSRALARADERGGRRGPWLRLLDRLGLGFDS